MKILLGDTLNNGTAWYRMRSFVNAFKGLGHEASTLWWDPERNFEAGWEGRALDRDVRSHLGQMVKLADVAIFQACHHPVSLAAVQAARAKHNTPILMDADDNFLAVDPDSLAWQDYRPGSDLSWLAKAQMEDADAVIVSTDNLKQEFGRSRDNIFVVPNGLDMSLWPLSPRVVNRRVRIGWQGGGAHTRSLEMLAPVVGRIAESSLPADFWFIGGAPKKIKDLAEKYESVNVVVDFRPVLEYPEWIRSFRFDIGLAPLQDSRFMRAKSDLRFLEYSAQAIPTIASKCEAYKTIKDGQTGCLAEAPEEWESLIRFLVNDQARRETIGWSAHEYLKNERTIQDSARIYVGALEEYLSVELPHLRKS